MYKTPDINLAVALIIKGETLSDVMRVNENPRGLVTFCFIETEQLPNTVNSFWREEIIAPVQLTLLHARHLKGRIKYVQKNG